MANSDIHISVRREALDFDVEGVRAVLGREAALEGFTEEDIRFLGGTASNKLTTSAVLLGCGELNEALRKTGIKVPQSITLPLGNYLEQHLPESFSQEVEVGSMPFGVYERAGKSQDVFTLCADSGVLKQERAIALILAKEFFGIEDVPDAWRPGDGTAGQFWLARSYSAEASEWLERLLDERPELLPPTINFDSGSIDTTPGLRS